MSPGARRPTDPCGGFGYDGPVPSPAAGDVRPGTGWEGRGTPVEQAQQQGSPARGPRRPIVLALLVVAVAGGVWAARRSRRGAGDRPGWATADPNARPGVRYVGDAACTRCHAQVAATYRRHPMGRSLMPIEAAPAAIRGADQTRVLFEDRGFQYELQRRAGRTLHREVRRGRDGRVVGQIEGEVRYVLGSGRRALAFLIERDGYLFESPITWYSQPRRWGLSPGFEGREARFERQVDPGCLACHANQVEHVAGTEGRYRPPIFRGHAIGCERCHGPGELHVRRPAAGGAAGPTIVNPRDLEPALREAVCQQCHLLGEATIARPGRDPRDYRPGLPWHEFVTVFVRPSARVQDHPNADHVEQMHQSRCFRASRGALGCISCHDPHELPPPEQKVAYYRGRCLECHGRRGCTLPSAARRARSPEDSCIACHMPLAATSDIPHVATTLHRIPRRGDGAIGTATAHRPPPDDTLLVPFHRDVMSPDELRARSRDLGVALRHRGEQGAAKALPLLSRALAERPDDVLARESQGVALAALGRYDEAAAALEAALERDPNRESTLEDVAWLSGQLRRRERSIAYWRRAIAVDPWRSSFHASLADQLALGQQWPAAAAAARRALRLNPASKPARAVLVLATLRMGSEREARAQFETLLEFAPADRDGLIRWFDSLR